MHVRVIPHRDLQRLAGGGKEEEEEEEEEVAGEEDVWDGVREGEDWGREKV